MLIQAVGLSFSPLSQEIAMTEKFKIGDIVQLKSGGPKMTVTSVSEDTVVTAWFAGSKKEQGGFPFDAVTIFKEEPKS